MCADRYDVVDCGSVVCSLVPARCALAVCCSMMQCDAVRCNVLQLLCSVERHKKTPQRFLLALLGDCAQQLVVVSMIHSIM